MFAAPSFCCKSYKQNYHLKKSSTDVQKVELCQVIDVELKRYIQGCKFFGRIGQNPGKLSVNDIM